MEKEDSLFSLERESENNPPSKKKTLSPIQSALFQENFKNYSKAPKIGLFVLSLLKLGCNSL